VEESLLVRSILRRLRYRAGSVARNASKSSRYPQAHSAGSGGVHVHCADAYLSEGALRKRMFGYLRGCKLRSDSYAAAVDHHHALRIFAATCFGRPEAILSR
jgi:hypothetical protein